MGSARHRYLQQMRRSGVIAFFYIASGLSDAGSITGGSVLMPSASSTTQMLMLQIRSSLNQSRSLHMVDADLVQRIVSCQAMRTCRTTANGLVARIVDTANDGPHCSPGLSGL